MTTADRPDSPEHTTPPPTAAAQVLPWAMAGVAVLAVLAGEYLLAMLSIAPFFGEYPTRTESLAIALVMISMVVLEAVLIALAWRNGRRWLCLIFALPGLAAAVAAIGLLLTTAPDDERSRPPWDITAILGGINLGLAALAVVVAVALTQRRNRIDHGAPTQPQ